LDQNPPYDELVQRINELEADNKNLHRSVEMLQENEERYRTLVEYSHDVLYSVSADQIITYVSPQIVNFGWTPEELISRNFLELAVAPESREHVIDSWNQGAVGNDTHPTEFKWIGRGAPVEWVEVVGNNFYDNSGNFLHQIGVLRDITARKRTEEAQKKVHDELERRVEERTSKLAATVAKLEEAKLRYRTLADFTYDWEYWQNPDGKFNYISPSCKRITSYSAEEFTANSELLHDIILPEDRAIWSSHRKEALKERKPIEVQFRIHKKNGEICWIEHACQQIINDQGEFLGVRASNRDITVRKQSEDALKASREEARMLAGQLITNQEAERKRLARELHDDITQRMAFLNIEMDKLEIQDQSLSETVRKRLRQIGDGLGELSSDIHVISRQLHPSILQDLGLAQAIEAECKNFTRLKEIPVTLELDGALQDLSKEHSLCIYRILQEGLRNTARHAKARQIQVMLSIKDDNMHFLIKDNGKGFNAASNMNNVGLGMASMRERARLIQGDLSIKSQLGKGTVIELRAPIASR